MLFLDWGPIPFLSLNSSKLRWKITPSKESALNSQGWQIQKPSGTRKWEKQGRLATWEHKPHLSAPIQLWPTITTRKSKIRRPASPCWGAHVLWTWVYYFVVIVNLITIIIIKYYVSGISWQFLGWGSSRARYRTITSKSTVTYVCLSFLRPHLCRSHPTSPGLLMTLSVLSGSVLTPTSLVPGADILPMLWKVTPCLPHRAILHMVAMSPK